ncbi:hypothetical protein D3C86_2206110 [compost metagenome]
MREPARSSVRHEYVVFEPDTELTWYDDHRFVGEAHAGTKARVVTAHDVRFLVDLEAQTMTGPMG